MDEQIFVCRGTALIRVSASRLTKAGLNVNLQDDSKADTTKVCTHQKANHLSLGNNGYPQKKSQRKDSSSLEGLEEFDLQIMKAPKCIAEHIDL